MKLRELIEELNLFERERVPNEIRFAWNGYLHPNLFDEEDSQNSF